MRYAAIVLVVPLLVSAASATSGSLDYKPGKWKTTTTMSIPMLPQPHVKTSTECVTEGDYSADRIMEGMQGQPGCTVGTPVVSRNTLRWNISCTMPEGSATGSGEFTIDRDGEHGRGTVEISVHASGQSMTTTMRLETERIGDCQ